MRTAKQKRSAEISTRATTMATDRSNAVIGDINSKTDQSMVRALRADREQQQQMAMQASALGRQGKTPEIKSINSQEPNSRPVQYQRVASPPQKSVVGKHKTQVVVGDNANDSIPPAIRKAMKYGQPRMRNDPAPRFQPNQPRNLAAHGITQNPVEEARRRRKLEARIRELSSQ